MRLIQPRRNPSSNRSSGQGGRIDAVIHCAGPYHRVDILKETSDGWREMFANNLDPSSVSAAWLRLAWSSADWAHHGVQPWRQLVSSWRSPSSLRIAIAKAGVLVLTRTLARALAPHGILVKAIPPGFIDSGSGPPEELESMAKRIPIPTGYIGTTQDAVVRFLPFRRGALRNGGEHPPEWGLGYLR